MIAGVISPSSLSLMQRYCAVQAKANISGIKIHTNMKKHCFRSVEPMSKRHRKEHDK